MSALADTARRLGEVTLPARFNGPPTTANGGYACGRLARFVPGPAEVTLRVPPPLDVPMAVLGASGHVTLVDGDGLVAEARAVGPVDVAPPVVPTLAEAAEAGRRHPWRRRRHLLSDCFVCGAERADGLAASAGPLAAAPDVGATVVRLDASLPHVDGRVAPELLWAALDCPSYTPRLFAAPSLSLLGRLTAELVAEARVGDTLVAVGWDLGGEGRKRHTASALVTPAGALVGRARATWIALPSP